MSTAQRTAIQNPANGLLVYDTNFNGFWFYTTAGRLALNDTKNAWSFSGNALAGTKLLGSTNGQPLNFIANNTERLRLSDNGNFILLLEIDMPNLQTPITNNGMKITTTIRRRRWKASPTTSTIG